MIHVIYPFFFLSFLVWMTYYKYQELGSFDETNKVAYMKAQRAYQKKWKKQEVIRKDKKNKENQSEKIDDQRRIDKRSRKF